MTETFADGRLTLTLGKIARLVLNAPAAKNAMSSAMWRAVPEITARIAADEMVRVLVLTGARDCFSAGADISEFAEIYATPQSALAANAAIRAALAALRALPCPVIARVQGPCVGGGVAITLACDHVIASDDAFFAIPPARLGIAYSPEDTAMLLERLTAPRAKEILMTARRLTAAEAGSWGLIDRVVPVAELDDAVGTYSATLAALSAASIRQSKLTVNALAQAAQDHNLAAGLAALFNGPDFAEGRAAFMERRKPVF